MMNYKSLFDAKPYATISPEMLKELSADLDLPDQGRLVKKLADEAPGGAFDPRQLVEIPGADIGYRTRWAVERFAYYGFEWDITGLCLESLHADAETLPWIVIINGGSANLYEFFLDPMNAAGLEQYLAQKMNVMLVTIPGNFKYGGWDLPPDKRQPQYLLDEDLPADEIMVRNAIFTNRLVSAGLKSLILRHTRGDVLVVGHSTSGELTFLTMGERELTGRLKGRVLGWGTGGPANIRKAWEEKVGIRADCVRKVDAYPPVWQLRSRHASGYVSSGYIGPLNPCGKPGSEPIEVAEHWLTLEERRRPNFKQVLQDVEHGGMIELKPKMEKEIQTAASSAQMNVDTTEVFGDLFAANRSPLTGYRKMVWVVGKWDQGHWNRDDAGKARELTIADAFREQNPQAEIRILVLDVPLTHYGHIERPREVAGALIAASRWLSDII
jgi:hypothetical protein